MVSTPNCPGSLMDNIMKEPEDTCIYKRLFMDYTYGLNRIYTAEEIAKARMSPSWEREYCLKFAGHIGNLLSQKIIDDSVELAERLKHIPMNPYAIHSLGIDPGFGSSATALVLTEHIPEHDTIRVLYAEQFGGDGTHPDPQSIIDRVFEFHRQYWNMWIPIDAANRGFITSLKIAFGESINYQSVDEVRPGNDKVLPISFSKEHKTMISHLVELFNNHHIAIPKEFDKLIIALKSAVVNEYSLDKEQSVWNDLTDAMRLSLRMYKIQ
jgi:hypothetical protein